MVVCFQIIISYIILLNISDYDKYYSYYIIDYLYYIIDYLYYIMYINYIIIYFQIVIFSDYFTHILFDYYYYLSNLLNVISEIFKILLNKQITLLYKSSFFKVVIYLSKGSQGTRISFGIVRNVKKSNWKWKIIRINFGKSFSRFCFCTSRISNCRVECIWQFQVGRIICKHLFKWFVNNQMKDSTCK